MNYYVLAIHLLSIFIPCGCIHGKHPFMFYLFPLLSPSPLSLSLSSTSYSGEHISYIVWTDTGMIQGYEHYDLYFFYCIIHKLSRMRVLKYKNVAFVFILYYLYCILFIAKLLFHTSVLTIREFLLRDRQSVTILGVAQDCWMFVHSSAISW